MRRKNLFWLPVVYLVTVLVMPLFMDVCAKAASTEILHLGATVSFSIPCWYSDKEYSPYEC